MKYFLSLIVTIAFAASLAAAQNSIVPLMEKIERLEGIDLGKYAPGQGIEIRENLKLLDERIRVVSFNILFDLYDHNLDEENRWPNRCARVIDMFDDMDADIVGVQELYGNQLDDLMEALSEKYEFFGSPCKDGEINGLFYKKERFILDNSRIWHLSKVNPENTSASTLTIIQLVDKINGKALSVLNVHLAFSSIAKREQQAEMIQDILSRNHNGPLVLTGDFNTFPSRLDLEKLPFYDGDYIQKILKADLLEDAKDASLLGHIGPLSTFTNDKTGTEPFKGFGTPGVFLDHIFVSPEVKVLLHAVNPAKVNGLFPSDHMPLIADIILLP